MNMRWWRMHGRVADDPKLQKLPPSVFKHWVNMGCLACSSNGVLPTVDDIAWRLRTSSVRVTQMISELMEYRLVDEEIFEGTKRFVMHDWNDWQYKSDVSTPRVKQHREQRRNVSSGVSSGVSPGVTGNGLASVSVSVSDSESVPLRGSIEGELSDIPLYGKYWDLVAVWKDPEGIDEGGRMWMMLVDSNEITDENLLLVIDGVVRYMASQKVADGFKMSIPKWLNGRRWKDHPKPAKKGEFDW